MLTITIQVNATPDMTQGVKEALAEYLERYGDTRAPILGEREMEMLEGTNNA